MTDPLIEVAEEMRGELFNEPGTPMWIRGQVCEWAARIRAFWTPQRRAFLEAAMGYCDYFYNAKSGTIYGHQPDILSNAYRALVESERGESEGR